MSSRPCTTIITLIMTITVMVMASRVYPPVQRRRSTTFDMNGMRDSFDSIASQRTVVPGTRRNVPMDSEALETADDESDREEEDVDWFNDYYERPPATPPLTAAGEPRGRPLNLRTRLNRGERTGSQALNLVMDQLYELWDVQMMMMSHFNNIDDNEFRTIIEIADYNQFPKFRYEIEQAWRKARKKKFAYSAQYDSIERIINYLQSAVDFLTEHQELPQTSDRRAIVEMVRNNQLALDNWKPRLQKICDVAEKIKNKNKNAERLSKVKGVLPRRSASQGPSAAKPAVTPDRPAPRQTNTWPPVGPGPPNGRRPSRA